MSVEIKDVVATAESLKALLVVVDDQEVWVPKSQIEDESEVYRKGHEGTLVVTDWFAKQKGWD